MAASSTKSLCLLMLLLLSSFSAFTAGARPLLVVEEGKGGVKDFIDDLFLWGVKIPGPNPGGQGHAATTMDTMGGVKDSGPSPGQGHGATTMDTMGVVQDSGPSPGQGHK
ncbi:hypothetical protein QJS04_geneDACA006286 [Acorus gramineus]|uniref:Uncharacterized protein n=1 Tax=Acorus gramineus TaxID=55184 RepID=A0AAV9AWG4_ACOGR|nr:hypothetical protein QJS04_geneDACA006286 [Acorus gramineus]